MHSAEYERLFTAHFFANNPLIAMVPDFAGVKLHGIPMALQTAYKVDFAGYAVELSGFTATRRPRKRIRRVEDKIHFGVLCEHPPTIPVDVLKLSAC